MESKEIFLNSNDVVMKNEQENSSDFLNKSFDFSFLDKKTNLKQIYNGNNDIAPYNQIEEKIRKKQEQIDRIRTLERIDKNNIKVNFQTKNPDDAFGNEFNNKLSESQRGEAINNKRSRLYKKHVNADMVSNAQLKATRSREEFSEAVKDRLTTGQQSMIANNDLGFIYTFYDGMTSKSAAKKIGELIKNNTDVNGEIKVNIIIKSFLIGFVNTNIDFDMSTDEMIAKSAERIEKFRYIMDTMKVLRKRLDSKKAKISADVMDEFDAKMLRMGRMINYYDARKNLMNNNYYKTHYNNEIASNNTDIKNLNSKKQEVIRLIKKVEKCKSVLLNASTSEEVEILNKQINEAKKRRDEIINPNKIKNNLNPTEQKEFDLARSMMLSQHSSISIKKINEIKKGKSEDEKIQPIREINVQQPANGYLSRKHSINNETLKVIDELINDTGTANSPMFFTMKKALENIKNKSVNVALSNNEWALLLLKAKNATNGYIGSYWNFTTVKAIMKTRYSKAVKLLSFINIELDNAFADSEEATKTLGDVNKITDVDTALKQGTIAVENLRQLKKNYELFFKKIDANVIDGEEEKLKKKLDYFKLYEKSFIDYEKVMLIDSNDKNLIKWQADNNIINVKTKFYTIFQEYKKLKFEMNLYRTVQNNEIDYNTGIKDLQAYKDNIKNIYNNDLTQQEYRTERSNLSKDVDKTLSQEQINGILQIDEWIVRNMFNGGMRGAVFKNQRIDYSDLASELFSLTKRERLNIYFLIEKKMRKNPTTAAVAEAQLTYIPDLEAFKTQMLASKVLVLSRITNAYVYWQKIGEALRVTRNYSKSIEWFSNTKEDMVTKIKNANDINENNESNEHESQISREINNQVAQLFELLIELKNKPKISDKEKKNIHQNINVVLENIDNRIADVNKIMPNEQKQSVSGNDNTGSKGIQKVTNNLDKYNLGLKQSALLTKIGVLGEITNLVRTLDFTKASGSVISGVLGAVGSLAVFISSVSTMNLAEFMSESTKVLSGLTSLTGGVVNAYEYIDKGVSTVSKAPTQLMQVVSGVGAGLKCLVGTVDVARGLYQMHKTTQMQSEIDKRFKNQDDNDDAYKNDKEYRYAQGMQELSRNLAKKKVARGTITLAAGGLLVGTVLAPAATMIPLGLLTGSISVDIVNSIRESLSSRSIQEKAFDTFYNLNQLYTQTFAEISQKRQQDNMPILSKKEMKLIKLQIRNKVSMDKGFSSLRDSMNFVAQVYGKKVYEAIVDNENPKQEDLDVYLPLFKALGLKYDREKKKPTLAALQLKLSGK